MKNCTEDAAYQQRLLLAHIHGWVILRYLLLFQAPVETVNDHPVPLLNHRRDQALLAFVLADHQLDAIAAVETPFFCLDRNDIDIYS